MAVFNHSMFWICSRICSISTLSSIDALLVSIWADFDPSVLASRFISCIRKSRRLPTGSGSFRILLTSLVWVSSRSSSSATSSFCDKRAISCSSRPLSGSISSSCTLARCRSLVAAIISGVLFRICRTWCSERSQRPAIICSIFSPSLRRSATMLSRALSSRLIRALPTRSRSGAFLSMTPGQRNTSKGFIVGGLCR